MDSGAKSAQTCQLAALLTLGTFHDSPAPASPLRYARERNACDARLQEGEMPWRV